MSLDKTKLIYLFLFFFTDALFLSVEKENYYEDKKSIIIEFYINALSESDLFPSTLLMGLIERPLKQMFNITRKLKLHFNLCNNILADFNGQHSKIEELIYWNT